jgi:hypothetical protein
VLTTHSPALLNALGGQHSENVVVCYRNQQTNRSEFIGLKDLPGYAGVMAAGRLGDMVADGKLSRPEVAESDFSEFNRLLGID